MKIWWAIGGIILVALVTIGLTVPFATKRVDSCGGPQTIKYHVLLGQKDTYEQNIGITIEACMVTGQDTLKLYVL